MRSSRRLAVFCMSGFREGDFTFSGECDWVDDGSGNFRLKFLTSGNFVPKKSVRIDVFMAGGGAGGSRAGGGAAYTATHSFIQLTANESYPIVIGAGGAGVLAPGIAGDGAITSAFGKAVNGGVGANNRNGGDGGSGGGTGAASSPPGDGGVDGGDGTDYSGNYSPGTGQGTTTGEFGNSDATKYAGGGAGANNRVYGLALDGGGMGASGAANTGGGGSGGIEGASGFDGGSGIVIIRNARTNIVPNNPAAQTYQRLAYIESTGTQYIDTGVVAKITHLLNVKMCGTGASIGMYNAAGAGTSGDPFDITCFSSANAYGGRYGWHSSGAVIPYIQNEVHDFYLWNGGFQCGETEYPLTPAQSVRNNYNIYLFATISQNETMLMRLYRSKIRDSGILVRDFIPALRISDSKPGLLDQVTNTFYTNAGTGEFEYSEVQP